VNRLAFRITHGNHPRFLRFPRTFQCLAVPRQPLKLLETLETRVLKRLASASWGESRISAKNRRSLHISRSHRATDFGSNRTQVPMRNDGIRPAFACLKIVILETVNMLASSSAVKARPIRSIRSGSDIGSAELFWGLHDCIYLLCGFIFFRRYCRILLWDGGSDRLSVSRPLHAYGSGRAG
jgi:hypothetical protein